MDQQHTTGTPAPKPPLWRGEYDRIYRLMAARLRTAAAVPRPAPKMESPPVGRG